MFNVLSILMLVAIFFVLWPCIAFAIEQTGLRNVNGILAPAATVLCILSMMGNLGNTAKDSPVAFVLIPWAALGYSLLFVLVLCLLGFLHGRLRRFFGEEYGQANGEDEIKRREVWGYSDKRNVDHGGVRERDSEEHKQGALARRKEGSRYE